MKTRRDQIFDALETQEARDYWNGMSRDYQNQFVDIMLAENLEAAAASVEEAAKAQFAAPEGFNEIDRRRYDDTEFVFLRPS